jgi:hypothetical protein
VVLLGQFVQRAIRLEKLEAKLGVRLCNLQLHASRQIGEVLVDSDLAVFQHQPTHADHEVVELGLQEGGALELLLTKTPLLTLAVFTRHTAILLG